MKDIKMATLKHGFFITFEKSKIDYTLHKTVLGGYIVCSLTNSEILFTFQGFALSEFVQIFIKP